jgi:tetratricopeptide (TPR) repeat protein
VKKHPNSALCNGNAGARYMDYGLYWVGADSILPNKDTLHFVHRDTVKVHRYADTATIYLQAATTLHKKYTNGFLNLGLCYFHLDRYEEAADAWGQAFHVFPSNPSLRDYQQLFIAKANESLMKLDYKNGARFLRCAALTKPDEPRVWNDYAGSSFMAMDFASAKMAFAKADEVYGNQIKNIQNQMSQLAQNGQGNSKQYLDLQELQNLYKTQQAGLNGGYRASNFNANKMTAYYKDTTNLDSAFALAQGFMGTEQFYPEAHRLLLKVSASRPNDATVNHYLDSLAKMEDKLKKTKELQGLK